MSHWRAWISATVIALFIAASGGGPEGASPRLARPLSTPPPHLGYGINVRFQTHIDPLFAPLDLEWLKLWEEYEAVPTTRYPYQVLFLIDCYGQSGDLSAWEETVRQIATAGQGFVEAYEICNEPNRAGWLNKDVNPHTPPDPAIYTQMLHVAYETIKEIDSSAIVVSAGLAPVGRIQGTCNGWTGNNCTVMDEREYARQMFLLGAGDAFDAFGYHPYGFAYAPETDPYSVPNGFAFRGAEVMYQIMQEENLGHKPLWATEFSWLRDPSYDPGYPGFTPGWCHLVPEYENTFGWMDVSESRQADYIVGAFQYADEHWPWMGAMFVWNLDWHNYNWMCEASRYFSVRKDNNTDLGTPAMAYDALAEMEKRPGYFGPRLAVTPTILTFEAQGAPQVFTGTVTPLNAGYRVLTWTASVEPAMALTPTLAITTGLQGTPLTVTVSSTGYSTGVFTGSITVTSTTTDVLDTPQTVTVVLQVEQTPPRLAVTPNALMFLTDVDEPGISIATLWPENIGGEVLTWTASVEPAMALTPTLAVTTGLQGTPLVVSVDSSGYAVGTFTGTITVAADPSYTLDTPQAITVTLAVAPEVRRVYFPLAFVAP